MADTTLEVKAKLTGERELRKARRRLNEIAASADGLHKKIHILAKGYSKNLADSINRTDGKWKKHFDSLDNLIKKFGAFTMGGLKLAIKAAGAEMLLMAASMVTLHGLFLAGQGLMKVYQGALNMISGAAAGATIALATVAAAMREQQAAMFAFRGGGMGGYDKFGSNMNRVRIVMRGLHTDTNLAAAGVENLNAAYAAVSQNSTFNRSSQTMLAGLMDFASAGQDVNKGMSSAGSLIGMLQDPEKGWGDIRAAAEAMGPQMKKAMKEAVKLGIDSADELMEAINSGQLAMLGGVTGQWDAVSGTLISRLKAAFTEIRNDFADFGQMMLGPVKDQLDGMVHTFGVGFTKAIGPLTQFAHGPFLDSMSGMADTVTDMFVSLVQKGPEVEGMFKRIGDRWSGFVDGWNSVLDRLRPFIDGARVIESAFGNMFREISRYISESFGIFNEFLQENAEGVEDFGSRLGELFAAFGSFQMEMKSLMTSALPYINKVVSAVSMVVRNMAGLMGFLRGMVGSLGDGAGAYSLLAGAMVILSKLRAWAGGFLFQKQTGTMNVNAGKVNVAGASGASDLQKQTSTMHVHAGTVHVGGASGGGLGGGKQLLGPDGRPLRVTPSGGQTPLGPDGRPLRVDPRPVPPPPVSSSLRNSWKRIMGRPEGTPSTIGQSKWAQSWRSHRAATRPAYDRFQQKASSRLGVGMGLSMLSGMGVPGLEQSQGALALGGMVGFMDPTAGMAIAGLGTAATSESAGMAGAGGLGGGLALAKMFGATPQVAIGMAIVGGIYGAITAGARKAAAQRKRAKAAGTAIAAAIIDSLGMGTAEDRTHAVRSLGQGALSRDALEALARRGGFEARHGAELGRLRGNLGNQVGNLNREDYQAAAGQYWSKEWLDAGKEWDQLQKGNSNAIFDFLEDIVGGMLPDDVDFDKLKKDNKVEMLLEYVDASLKVGEEALQHVLDQGQNSMQSLSVAMGFTEDEVLNLAVATGTNLYDATKSYGELARSVAAGLMHTVQDLKNAAGDRLAGGVSLLQTEVDRLAGGPAVNEAARNLYDLAGVIGDRAPTAEEQVNAGNLVMDIINSTIAHFGGDTLAAERALTGTIGPDGTSFGAGMSLGPDVLRLLETMPAFTEWQTTMLGESGGLRTAGIGEALLANLMSNDLTISGNGLQGADVFDALLGKGGFNRAVTDSDLLRPENYVGEGAEVDILNMLKDVFGDAMSGISITRLTEEQKKPSETFAEGTKAFQGAVGVFVNKIDEMFGLTSSEGSGVMRGAVTINVHADNRDVGEIAQQVVEIMNNEDQRG